MTTELSSRKLHLPCGRGYREGWVNADISPHVKTDVEMDAFRFPWPFEDNAFDEVYCAHFLEHVPSVIDDKPGMIGVMEEFHRITAPGARLEFRIPYHGNAKYAWADPTHTRAVHPAMFQYFTDASGLGFYSHARFDVENVTYKRTIEFGNFNMGYHVPKWLKVPAPNVGRRIETRVTVRTVK